MEKNEAMHSQSGQEEKEGGGSPLVNKEADTGSKISSVSGGSGAATGSVDMTQIYNYKASEPLSESAKKNGNAPWNAKEDESLMIAVLEERKTRTEGRKSDEEGNEDDWDVIDWDVIAASVPERSAVECLKRYLKHKKSHEGAKALDSHQIPEIPAAVEQQPSVMPGMPPQKRSIAMSVAESEELVLSHKKTKKEKDGSKWTDEDLTLLNNLAEQFQDSE